MSGAPSLSLFAIPDIPLIQAGDDIIGIILSRAEEAGLALRSGDILAIASKIVAKAEGRYERLAAVKPSPKAYALAAETGKDPRLVELILSESKTVSRKRPGLLVTEHRLGFVSANAGIDQSNIEAGSEAALLLPVDPDRAAAEIRAEIKSRLAVDVAVVISDTHGRAFRIGNVGVAIGAAGLPTLMDLRGSKDLYGRVLETTQLAYADLLASAAHLLSGEADEGLPAVVIRGLNLTARHGRAADMIRDAKHDLYR